MNLHCERCSNDFDASKFRGYCDNCLTFFQSVRDQVHAAQHPAPGVHADGKFTKEPGPQSVFDPVSGRNVCGLCGSEEIEQGYGLGSGQGIGIYNFCNGCDSFLDFCEDTGE